MSTVKKTEVHQAIPGFLLLLICFRLKYSKIQTEDTKVLWPFDYLKLGETKAPIIAVRRAQWPLGSGRDWRTGWAGAPDTGCLVCLLHDSSEVHVSDLGPCLDLACLQKAHVLMT